MDAFEHTVASLLERRGWWIRQSVKVALTKEEKREIGTPSAPRWEIDVLAYDAPENTVYVIECKSYIDSSGVRLSAFDGSNQLHARRFKLFNDDVLREVVFRRLSIELTERGFCLPEPRIQLCLAAGNIYRDTGELAKLFVARGWILWDRHWLRDELIKLAHPGMIIPLRQSLRN